MPNVKNIVAVDLGAESGRLVLCQWDGLRGVLREVYRFPNGPRQENGHLVWDMDKMWSEILTGLRAAAAAAGGRIDSIGVDGWGVDYVLLDASGDRIGHAYCYRDARNKPQMERAFSIMPRRNIYEITGVQFISFNTLYQLQAHIQEFPWQWENCTVWLTLPEYFLFRMSGEAVEEYTSAGNTQMLDVRAGTWSRELTRAFGLDVDKFAPLVSPGQILGPMRAGLAQELGIAPPTIIAPACHDTGSAVAGIPHLHHRLAFISSGTWSLVGTVLNQPVTSRQAEELNFTNEGGVGGTTRFLKNIVGLWLLQQSILEWRAQGFDVSPAGLAQACDSMPVEGPYFKVDSEYFLAPGDMIARINAVLTQEGFQEEHRPVELTAIILRSLARCYAEVIAQVEATTGKELEKICIVGGGVKNETLNRLTSAYTGMEVVRGSSESSAMGNAAIQIAALERKTTAQGLIEVIGALSFTTQVD